MITELPSVRHTSGSFNKWALQFSQSFSLSTCANIIFNIILNFPCGEFFVADCNLGKVVCAGWCWECWTGALTSSKFLGVLAVEGRTHCFLFRTSSLVQKLLTRSKIRLRSSTVLHQSNLECTQKSSFMKKSLMVGYLDKIFQQWKRKVQCSLLQFIMVTPMTLTSNSIHFEAPTSFYCLRNFWRT